MKKLLDAFAFAPTAERLKVALFLLYLLASMGAIDLFIEYQAGNWSVFFIAACGILLLPLILLVTRLARAPYLPLYAVLLFMVLIFHIGALTQHNHPANFVWYSIYPIVWFNLAGLRAGTILSLLGLITWITGWFIFPLISDYPRAPGTVFIQAVAAYVTTSIFAYIYEHTHSRQEKALKESAQCDFLTGVLNRRGFIEIANALLDQSFRFHQPCSVIIFDLDHFKMVNDTHGHEAGDKLLQDVVVLTQRHLRQSDRLGRWGGEEFIVLLPQTDLNGAHVWAEKIRQAMSFELSSHERTVSASFGIAACTPHDTLDNLVQRADQALYQAKKNGRNQVALAGDLALSPMPA